MSNISSLEFPDHISRMANYNEDITHTRLGLDGSLLQLLVLFASGGLSLGFVFILSQMHFHLPHFPS